MPDTVLEASEALWKDIHTYPRLRVTQESMITLRTSMPNNKICLLRYCYVDLKETDSEAGCSTVYLTVRSLCWPGARTMVHSRLWSLFSLASPFFTRISGDTTQTWSKRTSETVTHIQYTLLSVIWAKSTRSTVDFSATSPPSRCFRTTWFSSHSNRSSFK